MTRTGDHGGDSIDELEAALFIHSPAKISSMPPQKVHFYYFYYYLALISIKSDKSVLFNRTISIGINVCIDNIAFVDKSKRTPIPAHPQTIIPSLSRTSEKHTSKSY